MWIKCDPRFVLTVFAPFKSVVIRNCGNEKLLLVCPQGIL